MGKLKGSTILESVIAISMIAFVLSLGFHFVTLVSLSEVNLDRVKAEQEIAQLINRLETDELPKSIKLAELDYILEFSTVGELRLYNIAAYRKGRLITSTRVFVVRK